MLSVVQSRQDIDRLSDGHFDCAQGLTVENNHTKYSEMTDVYGSQKRMSVFDKVPKSFRGSVYSE